MILNQIGKWADAYPNCPGFLDIFCNELIVKFSSLSSSWCEMKAMLPNIIGQLKKGFI